MKQITKYTLPLFFLTLLLGISSCGTSGMISIGGPIDDGYGRRYEGRRYEEPRYGNSYGYGRYTRVLSRRDFNRLIYELRRYRNVGQIISHINRYYNNVGFTTAQIGEITKFGRSDRERLRILRSLNHKIVDPQNAHKLQYYLKSAQARRQYLNSIRNRNYRYYDNDRYNDNRRYRYYDNDDYRNNRRYRYYNN